MESKKIFINKNLSNRPFHLEMVEIIIPFTDKHSWVTRTINSIYQTVQTNRYLISIVDCGSKNKSFVNQLKKANLPNLRTFQMPEGSTLADGVNEVLKNPFRDDIAWVCFVSPEIYFENNNWLRNLGETFLKLLNKNLIAISAIEKNSQLNEEITDDELPYKCILTRRGVFQKTSLFEKGNISTQIRSKVKQLGYTQGYCGKSFYTQQLIKK